jgi:hypothetical protein
VEWIFGRLVCRCVAVGWATGAGGCPRLSRRLTEVVIWGFTWQGT